MSMPNGPSGTKREILETLRRLERADVETLTNRIGISKTTMREHLSGLQAMGLVNKEAVRDGPGRPRHRYFLTEEAEHLFPHAYAELASLLMKVIHSLGSEPTLRERIADAFHEHLQQYENLPTALESLGFYPEMREEGDNGRRTLIYHQCPFHDVAQKDPALCEIDQEVLSRFLGGDVHCEQTIVGGSSHCEFDWSPN